MTRCAQQTSFYTKYHNTNAFEGKAFNGIFLYIVTAASLKRHFALCACKDNFVQIMRFTIEKFSRIRIALGKYLKLDLSGGKNKL